MTQKSEKLTKKLTEWRKSNPSLSKKDERKLKRLGQKLRRLQRQQREETRAMLNQQMDEELERQRIIREVEAGETEEREGP